MPRYESYNGVWNESVDQARIDQIAGRTGYSEQEIFQAHLEIFLQIPGVMDTDRAERAELWEDYLDSMVNNDLDRADFFSEIGIDRGDFNWRAWRDAIGSP